MIVIGMIVIMLVVIRLIVIMLIINMLIVIQWLYWWWCSLSLCWFSLKWLSLTMSFGMLRVIMLPVGSLRRTKYRFGISELRIIFAVYLIKFNNSQILLNKISCGYEIFKKLFVGWALVAQWLKIWLSIIRLRVWIKQMAQERENWCKSSCYFVVVIFSCNFVIGIFVAVNL